MGEKSQGGREVEGFFEERGLVAADSTNRWERGKIKNKETEPIDKEIQKAERWEKITGSRFNKSYREIKKEKIPGYLKKG